MKQSHVCVLGEGAWGTAVATVLAENGHEVRLWCQDPAVAQVIQQERTNTRYLPGIPLAAGIQPVTDLRDAICGARWVFETIPVCYLRDVLQRTIICFSPEQIWVVLSKGIEQKTLMLPGHIIDDVFGCTLQKAVISGPSFAYDLARKQPTAVTLAATDYAVGLELQVVLATSYFRPYISRDFAGVQIGGACKNVYALGLGILDGAGFGDNAQAYILTRALHEMAALATHFGGKADTLYGLSGVGDLVMTAMGEQSRNRALGRRLGKGERLADILHTIQTVPEGINTVQSVYQLTRTAGIQAPISSGIYHIIFEQKPVVHFVRELMAQPLEAEPVALRA